MDYSLGLNSSAALFSPMEPKFAVLAMMSGAVVLKIPLIDEPRVLNPLAIWHMFRTNILHYQAIVRSAESGSMSVRIDELKIPSRFEVDGDWLVTVVAVNPFYSFAERVRPCVCRLAVRAAQAGVL